MDRFSKLKVQQKVYMINIDISQYLVDDNVSKKLYMMPTLHSFYTIKPFMGQANLTNNGGSIMQVIDAHT